MCDQKESNPKSSEDFFEIENFKSCFARSVIVNRQYKPAKGGDSPGKVSEDSFIDNPLEISQQDSPVRYRKNNRSASMDESKRFSCGSILSRRASMALSPKRNEIPVENIMNQNKIETLQWQLKEVEKSRGMYKAVLKQVMTFLEKAHVSLEHLGNRINRKNSVPRSKSDHHIVADCDSSTQSQRSMIDEHISSWNSNKKQDCHPEEIPPEKLSQEAFRLLRTAQSLLNTQEPNLASTESLSASEEPSDIEFLAQLAREFPSDSQKPQRATSFSLSPKLILPENDLRISTAFNRKLSLQLNEIKRNSGSSRMGSSKCDPARSSVAESEYYSLPPGTEGFDCNNHVDPLRSSGSEILENRAKATEKTPGSPATSSISSTEDESGFSSLNSFQEVGLPLVNSTAIDEVSARSVLLKSMLHNNSDYNPLSNDSEHNCSILETTLTSLPRFERSFVKRNDLKHPEKPERKCINPEEEKRQNLNDIKLWQKPAPIAVHVETMTPVKTTQNQHGAPIPNSGFSSPVISQGNHKRWHSIPEQKIDNQSPKVLWV